MRNDTIFSNNNNERRPASLARICHAKILPEKQTLRKNVNETETLTRWDDGNENDDDENDEQNGKSSKVIWFR